MKLLAESEVISKLRNESVEVIIADAKYGFIEGALKETVKQTPRHNKNYTKQDY